MANNTTVNDADNQWKIKVTPSAVDYLVELLQKQEDEVMGLRLFVNDGGTPMAETCIAWCREEEIDADAPFIAFPDFNLWLDPLNAKYLEEAEVDYSSDAMGGQLTVRAPNSRMAQITEDSTLEERINYILYNEINPALASHGGMVTLEEIVQDSIAVLRFGGGCQGCGMVDVTLKQGVEKTLLEQLPQLAEVRDVTDHSMRENAYYQD